jgi:hypothetical protein
VGGEERQVGKMGGWMGGGKIEFHTWWMPVDIPQDGLLHELLLCLDASQITRTWSIVVIPATGSRESIVKYIDNPPVRPVESHHKLHDAGNASK